MQGRGAKLSLHSRVQQQNGFLNNVRPTSPTSAPQNIVQDLICRPENPELLNVSSFEKNAQKMSRTGSQKWSLNVPVSKANACFGRFLFHFFLEPSKFIIQTTEARQHVSTPQNLSTKINYFCYVRTHGNGHLLILHSRT